MDSKDESLRGSSLYMPYAKIRPQKPPPPSASFAILSTLLLSALCSFMFFIPPPFLFIYFVLRGALTPSWYSSSMFTVQSSTIGLWMNQSLLSRLHRIRQFLLFFRVMWGDFAFECLSTGLWLCRTWEPIELIYNSDESNSLNHFPGRARVVNLSRPETRNPTDCWMLAQLINSWDDRGGGGGGQDVSTSKLLPSQLRIDRDRSKVVRPT